MEFNFPTTPQEAGQGTFISFLPLSPGAGAATLACMTALTASQYHETALIDLTPQSKVRSYMGYQGEVTAVSILDINGVSSPEGIFSASEDHHAGIKVFPGIPPRTLDAAQIDTQLTLKAVNYLKKASPLTIAVIGELYKTGWIPAMLSDVICVVARPDRPSMDAYREVMDFLGRLGCEGRIVVILNQQGYPGCVEPKGSVKWFSPDYIIDYDKHIPRDCNRRELKPDTKMRNLLLKIIKRGETA